MLLFLLLKVGFAATSYFKLCGFTTPLNLLMGAGDYSFLGGRPCVMSTTVTREDRCTRGGLVIDFCTTSYIGFWALLIWGRLSSYFSGLISFYGVSQLKVSFTYCGTGDST